MVLTMKIHSVFLLALLLLSLGGAEQSIISSNGFYRDYRPEFVLDGEDGTYYVGTGENNQLDVDFPQTLELRRVTILFHPDAIHRPRGWKLEARTPEGEFQLLAESEKLPDPLTEIILNTPVKINSLQLHTTRLSQFGDSGVAEIILNTPLPASTASLWNARPVLRQNRSIHYQFFDCGKMKFYHHGDGLLFYSGDPTRGTLIEPLAVFSPLAAGDNWFTSLYGEGRHRIKNQLPRNGWRMDLRLGGPAGLHRFRLESTEEHTELLHDFDGRIYPSKQPPTHAGMVLRLPVAFWQGGTYQTSRGESGTLHAPHLPTGALGKMSDLIILGGDALTLTTADGKRKLAVSAPEGSIAELRLMPRSGYCGHFLDFAFVVSRATQPFSIRWNIEFSGDFSQPIPGYDRPVKPGALPECPIDSIPAPDLQQIMAQNRNRWSGFYGAVFLTGGDRNGLIEKVPLSTRNAAPRLAAQFLRSRKAEDFERAVSALDYLSSAVTPWNQYGDVRLGSWNESPFLWGMTEFARAIELLAPHVEPQRLHRWRGALHLLYNGGLDGLRDRLEFKHDIGPNVATYALQILTLAEYFDDPDGRKLAADGMEFALSIGRVPLGMQSDYSYSHGNTFDTIYYRWLLETACEYRKRTEGSEFALSAEAQRNFDGMVKALQHLCDNGAINSMTAHPKHRLNTHYNRAVADVIPELCDVTDENFVAQNENLPLGEHFFPVAGLLVSRNVSRYFSSWWNAAQRVRDDARGANVNYNTKLPVGAFFWRDRNAPRALAIPSDNCQFSGGIFLEPTLSDKQDWATGFDNFSGSVLAPPRHEGEWTILDAALAMHSRRDADAPAVHLRALTLIGENALIRILAAPAQEVPAPLIDQPLVVRQGVKNNREFPSETLRKSNFDTLKWQQLAGGLKYSWTLSDDPVDGSQIFSRIPPSRVWRLRAGWDGKAPLISAWIFRQNPDETTVEIQECSKELIRLKINGQEFVFPEP